jgi:hypothetical protein
VATGWRKSSHSHANGNCVEAAGDWRKSSHSHANGNCVEAMAGWRKSSASTNNGSCVEVATAVRVRVRDSKDPGGPVLSFTRAEWAAFTTALRGA